MIRHIVLWKKNDDFTEERVKTLMDKLAALREIPEVISLDFGENFSKLSQGYDYALVAEFVGKDELKAYNKHPIHLEVVELLQKYKLELAVIDYEV